MLKCEFLHTNIGSPHFDGKIGYYRVVEILFKTFLTFFCRQEYIKQSGNVGGIDLRRDQQLL